MNTLDIVSLTAFGIGAFAWIMGWIKKPKRSDDDKLISCLESCVFILLHSTSPGIKAWVKDIYYGLPRNSRNGKLDQVENDLKHLHEWTAKAFEKKQKEIREKGPEAGAF